MEKMRSTAMGSLKLLGLVCQHLAAPLVAFGISYAAAFAILFFTAPFHLGPRGFTVGCAFVGFCGVMMGARCLPVTTRRFGSIGLLLLGLFYFYHYIADWGPDLTYEGKVVDASSTSLQQLIFLAIGGLIAVTVIWWMSYLEREFPKRKHPKGSVPLPDSGNTC
jgi:hypothetical protein